MKPNLLIVDDEPVIRRFLENYLNKHFSVVTKNDGEDAMEWLNQANTVDAIIADLNMPRMNGLDFIRAVRNNQLVKEVPLIILSGNEKSADKIACLVAGADDYVVKPFNPEEILARLNNILRRISRIR